MTVVIHPGNFENLISEEGIALIDCWAPWCRNCDDSAKAFRRAAERYPEHVFATLNTQEQVELRSRLGVEHVPSLLLFRDGVLLLRQPGSFDEAALDSIVKQAESLDMDLVRTELASAQAEDGPETN